MDNNFTNLPFDHLLVYFISNSELKNLHKKEIDKELSNQLNNFLSDFIIQGNFVKVTSITAVTKYFEHFKVSILDSVDEVEDTEGSKFAFELSKLADNLNTVLIQFLNIIHSQLEVSTHIVHQRHTFIETDNKFLKVICEYCNLFILDYSISDDILFFEKLNKLLERFKAIRTKQPFDFQNIFEHKVNFLKYKWLKRQKYNRIYLKETVRNDYSEKYVFNDNIIDLDNKIKIGVPYFDTYKDWVEKIEYHYFNEFNRDNNFIEESLRKDSSLNTYDLYLRIKIFKDIEKDIIKLNALEEHIHNLDITKEEKKKNLFYYYNNCYSLFIMDSNKSYDDVKKEYLRLKEIFEQKSNYNFFIHLKFLNFVISKFSDEKTIISLDFKELYNVLELCKSNFQWCHKGLNLLYDFSFEESFVSIEGTNVYHASCFLLPFSLTENKKKIDDIELQLRNIEYEFEKKRFEREFVNQKKFVENQNKSIVKKIDKLSKKSIQTITIFTAIISFIVGTVGVYKFIDSFFQALIFILVFGISISIFVFLVFLSTDGILKIKQYKSSIIWMYSIAILLIAIFFTLMSFENLSLTNSKKYLYKQQLDSISSAYQEDILNLQKENNKIRKYYQEEVLNLKKENYKVREQYSEVEKMRRKYLKEQKEVNFK